MIETKVTKSIKESERNSEEIAVCVKGVSKTFIIPHEKHTSLKSAAIHIFDKKEYKKFEALKDISFEVKKGEFFGIIGRNGSGKSTLLKILAGIYVPDKGRVEIRGKVSPFLELGVGFNMELTGRENLFLGGAILGLSRQEVKEKFDKIVAFSELEEFIDMKLKNYSSGMQVRLAFSLAINVHADILLMDEVLAVGDSNFQGKCLEEFSKYREQGKTVILVTHDIGVIQRYCDRAILLRNGEIVEIGEASVVGDKYIYQNISDEEKRMIGEENKKAEGIEKGVDTKIIQKKAEITKVEFLDSKGNKKNVFETGDDISIRVYFKINKKINNINFGIALFNQENNYIFGVNTIIDKVNVERYIKKGYYQVDYKNIPLRTNSYFIKSAIFGANDSIVIDSIDRSRMFKVFSRNRNQGIVDIDYRWY